MKKSELKHMKLHHCLAGTLGVIGLIVGLQPTIVPAATVDVGDAAALGSAIANCADGDTIVLTNNITVSGEVALSGKGLTIQGNHHSVCVPVPGLNGSGVLNASPSTFRVFNLNASGKTNTLHNMTVMGGNPSSNGGGILNSGGTLVLQDVTVAQSGGANCSGGGLQNSSGTVYLRDCNIKYNAANYGGGFLNSGTGAMMFIERCTFSGNQSLSSNGGGGAGENQQTLYANNSTFANNKSTELGGAINNYGGTSYFVDCTFVGNVAYSTGYMGGAIAQHIGGANSGTLSLVNSLFAYNYHFNGSTFDLNDIYNYSGTAPLAYHSIFQSTTNQLGSSSVGITVYAGDIGGTNDTLFSCGGTAQVLGPSGTPIGSGTIYQPSVAIVGASQTPTAVLKPGSFAFGKGARAAFSSAPATPVVGYYNGSSWTALSGSSPANYEVITDQNGTARGDSATVGAVTSTASGPSITAAPDSQTVPVGGTVTLSVTATGTGPLYYQWFKNGGMVPEAIDSTLTLTGAGVVNSGVYYVVVTNPYGLSISLPVTVTVGAPQLLAWGDNYYGQLGDGTKIDKQLPEAVASGVIAAAAGADHSLFVKADGSLWAVGFNGDGELGDGTTATLTQPESIATNVVAVAAGAWHSLFLKRDGTLWGMGANYNGQLGDGTQNQRVNPVTIASNVVALAAGWYHSLYLKTDGTLWGMGSNCSGQLGNGTTLEQDLAVSVASNVVALAAGSWHSLYLKIDGTLWGMGANSYGQLGDGNNTGAYLAVSVASNVVALAAGSVHSLFLTKDETLWAMGDNGSGQLGNGTNTAAYLPESVVSNVVAVTAGMYDSLCLKSDGTLWAMGANSVGQLGDGTKTTRYSPVAVPGMSVATVVSSGSANHTLAIGVPLAPVITGQPASQTVLAGSPVTFTVTATSLTPLAYQWQFNGTNLLSATNASYTLARAALSDAGTYTVSVANLHGATVSAPATLTVTQPMANITVAADPANAGSASGGGTFLIGSTNLCSATASNGWTFVAWSDGSTTNPYAIVVETNLTLTAKFAPTVTVTVAANPTNAGSVSGGGVLIIGSNMVLTATASNNWAFVAWNDGATNNPCTITVPATNITYTATFAPTATITVVANPSGAGSVSGGGTFVVGSTHPITAVASNGWIFVGWSNGSTNNPCALMVASNLTITATFVSAATVTTLALPPEGGLTSGDGTYAIGGSASVTATATNGWVFLNWNGTVTNNPYVITVPATNITYTASFARTATITVVANPSAAGTVSGGGTFLVGSTNVIAAASSNNWVFTGWSDGATNNPHAIVVESNRTYAANFAAAAMVTTLAVPAQGGSTTGGGTYAIGTTATLTATPSNGWIFLNWNGTVTNYTQTGNTNNPLGVRVASSINYAANFAQVENGFVYTVINKKGTASAEIIGYTGPKTDTIVVPSVIGGLAVTTIGTGAFWWFNYSKIVLPGSIEAVETGAIDAGILDLTALGDLAGFVVEAGAFAEMGEILLGIGVSAAMIAYLADLCENLVAVQAAADPERGGYCTGSGLYIAGTPVLVTASANSGWRFNGWSDGGIPNKYWVTAPYTVTARFVPVSTVTVVANPEDGGLVSGGGTFDVGSQIILKATNNIYWKFMEWSDGDTNATHTIQVPASDITYTATFEELKLELEVEADPTIGGYAFGSGEYGLSEIVTLSAIPFPTWKFKRWGPDLHILTNGPVPPLFSFIVTPGMLGQKLKLDAAFSTDVKIGWVANPYYAGSVEAEEAYEWPPVLQDLPLMTAVPADGWEFVSWDTPVTTNNTSNPFCPLLGLVQPFDFTVTANFTPTRLVTFVSSNSLTLNWPTNQIGWLLQAQTNGLSSGVSNDWHDLPGTGAANSLVVPIDPANRAVFYRLRQP